MIIRGRSLGHEFRQFNFHSVRAQDRAIVAAESSAKEMSQLCEARQAPRNNKQQKKEANLDISWFEVCQDTEARKDQCIKVRTHRCHVEEVRKYSPFSSLGLQNTISTKAANNSDFPSVQCFLDALIGRLITLSVEGDLMLKDALNSVKSAPGSGARVL